MGMMNSRRGVTYLYNEGVENVAWVTGYSAGTTGNTQSKEATYLHLEALSIGQRTYVTDAVVDLTSISTIWVDWVNTGDAGMYSCLVASTNKTASYTTYNARTLVTGAFVRGTNSLDVSGLSGNHYIRVHASGVVGFIYSKIKAYKVWLE